MANKETYNSILDGLTKKSTKFDNLGVEKSVTAKEKGSVDDKPMRSKVGEAHSINSGRVDC